MPIIDTYFGSFWDKQRGRTIQWHLVMKPGIIRITGALRLGLDYDLSDVPVYEEVSEKGHNGSETSGFFKCSKFTLHVNSQEGDDPEPGSGPKTGEISVGVNGASFVFDVPHSLAQALQGLGRGTR